jgi:hypothetical protein
MASGAGERIVQANPIALAGGRVIASPFQFYFDGNDNLRVEGWNTVTGASLLVQGRFVSEAGTVEAFSRELPLTADRLRVAGDFAMARGFILNLVVTVIGAAPKIGQTFARVSVIRGFTGATLVMGVLLQGYVTSQQGLGWPGSPIVSSTDGEPVIRFFNGTTPAPGAEISETVPTGARWSIVRCLASLTTSGVGGNRYVNLACVDSGLYNFRSVVATPITAGVFWVFVWSPNLQLAVDPINNVSMQPLAFDSVLLAGQKLETYSLGLDAGDQFSEPRMYVREWLDVA